MADPTVVHPFDPIYDVRCRILILGTIPSRQSRSRGFYYAYPQNRFWPVLARVFQVCPPIGRDEKIRLLLDHHIALWDVLHSCAIDGSADSSIRQPQANDLSLILDRCPIGRILANGQTAGRLYDRHIRPLTGQACQVLPSTSPANARCSLADLCAGWQVLVPLSEGRPVNWNDGPPVPDGGYHDRRQ